jgi:hypothetical protein
VGAFQLEDFFTGNISVWPFITAVQTIKAAKMTENSVGI